MIRGHGRLAGEQEVQVTAADGGTRMVTARHAVVLAAGTTASVPDLPGLRDALPWTSRDVTNVHEVPRRVAVMGGGVVACESACWLRGLGVEELTILVRGSGLLERNEPFAGELVAQAFRDDGVRVLLNTAVDEVDRVRPEATGEGLVHGGEVDRALRRPSRGGRRTGGGRRAHPGQRGHRAGHGRGGRRRLARIRHHRRSAGGLGVSGRLAVRRRRHHRPGPAHPHGQVPGPDLRGGHRRPGRGPADPPGRGSRTSPTRPGAAGDVHRPAGRVGRPARSRPGPPGSTWRPSSTTWPGSPAPRCCGTGTSAGPSW